MDLWVQPVPETEDDADIAIDPARSDQLYGHYPSNYAITYWRIDNVKLAVLTGVAERFLSGVWLLPSSE